MVNTYRILMNSGYGSLALKQNCFAFGRGQTSAITSGGRTMNRWVGHRVSQALKDEDKDGMMSAIVGGDTDSLYVKVDGKDLDEALEKLPLILDTIKRAVEEFEDLFNVYKKGLLKYEQEEQLSKMIFVAPKRYVGKRRDGTYKVTGLEIKNASNSPWVKEKMKIIIDMIFDECPDNDIAKKIEEFKSEFRKMPLNEICIIKSVNNLNYVDGALNKMYREEYDKKGNLIKKVPAPINSRGSIIFNRYLERFKITEFEPIREGDKVYILHMAEISPEIEYSNVIAFKDPKSMEPLRQYIHWDKLFEKVFLDKMKTITDPLNISLIYASDYFEEWLK